MGKLPDKAKQRFRSEGQLYRYTLQCFKNFEEKVKDRPQVSKSLYSPITLEERTVGNQHLYVIGEAHGSITPVEYVHQHLFPTIKTDPHSWLFMLENRHEPGLADPSIWPTGFYFLQLGSLLNIPQEEALVDIYELESRKKISEKSGLSDTLIDELLLSQCLHGLSPDERKLLAIWYIAQRDKKQLDEELVLAGEEITQFMSDYLKKPLDYILELYTKGPTLSLDFGEALGKPWNECSRENFHKVRKQYEDKKNILIRVGWSHLPVFLE